MKALIVVVILAAGCHGCYGYDPVQHPCPAVAPWYIDPPDRIDSADLDDAVSLYNDLVAVPFFELAPCERGTVGCITIEVEPLYGCAGEAKTTLRMGEILTCDIRLDPFFYIPVVLAHELGHCIGLPDNNDPRSLMYYKETYRPRILTEEDILDIEMCR